MAAQVRDGIVRLVKAGVLSQGSRLPTVRELAVTTGVNRNTIQRIYRELSKLGLLETHVGDGTYVAHRNQTATTRLRLRLQTSIREAVESGLRLGFGFDEIEATMQVEFAKLRAARTEEDIDFVRSRTRFSTWRKYSASKKPERSPDGSGEAI